MHLINEIWVKQHVKHRLINGHKKTFGHVLVVAGSEGKAGAAILCSKAALHSGCGMVTALIPKEAIVVLLAQCPEVMYLNESNLVGVSLSQFDAILIGPGLGFSAIAKNNLHYILKNYNGPVVIDADALTIIGTDLSVLKTNHIITPHPGEFSKLLGITFNEKDREILARDFITKTNAVLVLKGANTFVASFGNEILQNTTGNDGMATAGSGDVLAGIIVAICAQGYAVHDAAAIGVFIHGLAGDKAIENSSKSGLIASDIIHYVKQINLLD